jgi:hypothetical protein
MAARFGLAVLARLVQLVLGFYGFWLVWRVLLPVLPSARNPDQRAKAHRRRRPGPGGGAAREPRGVPAAQRRRPGA